MIIAPGSTFVSVDVQILDDSGLAVTGLAAATFPAIYYRRNTNAAATQITLSDLALITTAWTSGGVKEREQGFYRLDLPDAALANAGTVKISGEATGKHLLCEPIEVRKLASTIAAGDIATDAIDAASLKADAVTKVQNGLSTLTAQQVWEYGTRTLSSFGTLVADVWAYATRRVTNIDDTRAAKIDNLDAAISSVSGGASGDGPHVVTITTSPVVEGANVSLTVGVTTYRGATNASGQAVFNSIGGTGTLRVSYSGYTYTATTHTIDGTEAITATLTAVTTPDATPPGYRSVRVDAAPFTDNDAESVENISVKVQLQIVDSQGNVAGDKVARVTGTGQVLRPGVVAIGLTNSSGYKDVGLVPTADMTLPSGYTARYRFTGNDIEWKLATVASGSATTLAELTAWTLS